MNTGEANAQEQRDTDLVKRHVSVLQEQFDSVQVFVTKYDSHTGTFAIVYGSGNWYTRVGQVQRWCEQLLLDSEEDGA